MNGREKFDCITEKLLTIMISFYHLCYCHLKFLYPLAYVFHIGNLRLTQQNITL